MSKMNVQNLVLGAIGTNVYLVRNKENGHALIIDPADSPARIRQMIDADGLIPDAVLLTHGHFDHIGAVDALREIYDMPVYAMQEEEDVLTDAGLNLSASFGAAFTVQADRFLRDSDVFELAGFSVKALHTPGHTIGGCCYYFPNEQAIFTGDTLFCESYGRTDFPTGSSRQLQESVRRLLKEIPENTAVYPGHEMFTTIAHEKRYNPLAC